MKRFVAAAFLGAAVVGFFVDPTPATAQTPITLRLHTFLPPVANPVKHFMQPWADKIAKDSDGRHQGPGLPVHAARRQSRAIAARRCVTAWSTSPGRCPASRPA